MNCENPTTLFRRPGLQSSGRFYPPVSFSWITDHHLDPSTFEEVAVPCGHCFSCLKNKARDVTVRAFHESRLHKSNCFVTLTVSPDKIDQVFPPVSVYGVGDRLNSLDHRPFQLFMKRLRKRLGTDRIRFLMCAEYGERSLRPHFHAILFGVSPDERSPVFVTRTDPLLGTNRTMSSGFLRSKAIEESWPFGNVYIGSVSPASIAYCAGYTMKAYTLGRDKQWYIDRGLVPEYQKWSRNPGLGAGWLDNNLSDLYRENDFTRPGVVDNSCLMSGCTLALPRYYRDRVFSLADKDVDILSKNRDLVLLSRQKCAKIINSQVEQMRLACSGDALNMPGEELKRLDAVQNRLELQKYQVAQRKRL